VGNQNAEHVRVVADILARCGARPDCRIWANNSGVARGLTGNGIVRFGLKGSADILGILSGGQFFSIEVKTGSATQRPEQKAFQAMVTKFGGIYLLVRSAEEVESFLNGRQSNGILS
jgi:hypothetical protein